MAKLNDAQITSKCVELSKCLVNVGAGLIDYDLGNSRAIGDAARIAVSIKLAGELTPETFAAISTALKVNYRLARSEILDMFEGFNWVNVRRKGGALTKIIEQIPPAEDILSNLGKLWKEREPTAIDEASVNGLYELSKRPFEKSALLSELGLADAKFQTFFEYGEQAHYLGRFSSLETGKEVVWTPLYWAGKTDSVIKFLQKQSEKQFSELESITRNLVRYPGIPDEKLPKNPLIDSGIYHGYFPSLRITDRQQTEHEYVFAATPQFEVDSSKDLYEKARMIVSCIRHGQYHAEVTKILYPRSILNAMRNDVMKPHPYADVQYVLLGIHGVVNLEPATTRYGKAFKVKWIDTPENNLAADIADELLKGEEPALKTREEIEAKEILVQGMFNYSSEQRRIKATREIRAKPEFNRLMEMISGVRG
ncbi:MAG: hypothetical protein ACFFA1_08505 [Promethearchaeota archaeon]